MSVKVFRYEIVDDDRDKEGVCLSVIQSFYVLQ